MKLTSYAQLIFLFSFASCLIYAGLPKSYSMSIKMPECADDISLPAYFRGRRFNLKGGYTSLPALPKSILITESVNFKTKGNTIHYLVRKPELSCVCFDLNFIPQEKETSSGAIQHYYTWEVDERDSSELPLRISEDTLVILTKSDFISSLVVEEVVPNNIDIVLPTVQFKTDICVKEFSDVMLHVLMGAMDLDAVHRNRKEELNVSCKECVVVSAAKPSYESHQ